jgi:hypothetical protein
MTHKEKFLEKAIIKFGNKFDYSFFIYINAKTKGIIICPEHGNFMKSPEKHITKDSNGCNKCYYDKCRNTKREKYESPPRITIEKLLDRIYIKFGNKFLYNLDNYNGIVSNNIEITCAEHGKFYMTPRAHLLSNTGCVKCSNIIRKKSKTKSYEDSIEVVKKIHNNKYIYPIENKDIYINKQSKIRIICSEHGEFIKSIQKHQSGQGCFKCKVNSMVDHKILVGGYSHILFDNDPSLKNRDATLYYFSINNGEFYKIGITINDPRDRGKSLKSKSKGFIKNYNIIHTERMSLYEAFLKEESILEKFSDKRTYTKWTTELFTEDVLLKDKK